MSTENEDRERAGKRGTDQTFYRTAVVLGLLAGAANEGLRFTDLQRQTRFSKATLHRLLAGLEEHGFIDLEQPGSRYFPGFRLGLWAAAARNRHGLAQLLGPIVRELSERVQDTAYLSIRANDMAVCVALHEGTGAVRALPLSPGDLSALGVGSAAAAILSTVQSEEEITSILAAPDHRAYCHRRGVSHEHIRKHLERTRELGYAYVDDLNPDMTGIAMALRTRPGSPSAAISVATIHSKVQDVQRRQSIIESLREAANKANALIAQLPG